MNLPEVKISLDTSEDNLKEELNMLCLKWAECAKYGKDNDSRNLSRR